MVTIANAQPLTRCSHRRLPQATLAQSLDGVLRRLTQDEFSVTGAADDLASGRTAADGAAAAVLEAEVAQLNERMVALGHLELQLAMLGHRGWDPTALR